VSNRISKESSKSVLEWTSEYKKQPLKDILTRFVHFYYKNGNNKKFFTGIKGIPEITNGKFPNNKKN